VNSGSRSCTLILILTDLCRVVSWGKKTNLHIRLNVSLRDELCSAQDQTELEAKPWALENSIMTKSKSKVWTFHRQPWDRKDCRKYLRSAILLEFRQKLLGDQRNSPNSEALALCPMLIVKPKVCLQHPNRRQRRPPLSFLDPRCTLGH